MAPIDDTTVSAGALAIHRKLAKEIGAVETDHDFDDLLETEERQAGEPERERELTGGRTR